MVSKKITLLRRKTDRVLADQTAAAVLSAQATQAFLTQDFEPKISSKAILMADRLDQLLAPLLAPPALDNSATLESEATEFYDAPSRATSAKDVPFYDENGGSLPDTTIVVDAVTGADWVSQWKQDLKEIFEQALNLRVTMEKMGGRYDFFFPRPGLKYNMPTTNNTPLLRAPEEPEPEKRVLLTLLPRIGGRFQAAPGDAFGEWQVVSVARFVVFNET